MRRLMNTAALLLLVVLTAPAWAQINDVYQLSPFVNSNAATGEQFRVFVINPGEQGTPISARQGTVCADIYVFDSNQEMVECCSCPITANGMITLFPDNLLGSPLTGIAPAVGVLKIISDSRDNCNAVSPFPTPDLRAWYRDVTFFNTGGAIATINGSQEQFAQAPLQADEQGFLGQACAFVLYLGSGKGQCTCPGSP